MGPLRVNTLKDHCNFFLHYGLTAAIAGGTFVALGSPLLLGGVAIGATALIHYGTKAQVSDFQEAVDEEKEQSLKIRAREFLTPRSKAAHYYEKMRDSIVEGWVSRFAKTFGLETTPEVLVMRPSEHFKGASANKGLGTTLREQFNKHASAFAFSHEEKGNVVLSNPIVEQLDERELQGVVAHEVGHIAAGHTKRQEAIRTLSLPAQILGSANKALTIIFSLKNMGIVAGATVLSGVAVGTFAYLTKMDSENAEDVHALNTIRRYANSAAIAGLSIVFQAPDMLLAEGLRFATHEGLNLIQQRYSRRNEFQADRLAGEVTRDPMGLSLGLKKVVENSPHHQKRPSHDKTPGWLSSFFGKVNDWTSTHPNVERRYERLHRMGEGLNAWQPS